MNWGGPVEEDDDEETCERKEKSFSISIIINIRPDAASIQRAPENTQRLCGARPGEERECAREEMSFFFFSQTFSIIFHFAFVRLSLK